MSTARMELSENSVDLEPTPDRLLQLGYSFRNARAFLSAVELGVFTELAGRPLAANELALRVGIAERGSTDFFDALLALGLLQRDKDGSYSNTPEAAAYLDRQKSTYIGGTFEQLAAQSYAYWNLLTPALKTGQPQSGPR